jgi:hypothetical protein
MSRLIAFGDSFTFGTDLEDCIQTHAGNEQEKYIKYHYNKGRYCGLFHHEPSIDHRIRTTSSMYSYKTWPALLAHHQGKEYLCHAKGGASNDQITRLIYNYVNEFNINDLIVINWTWIDRIEVHNPENNPTRQWEQINPHSTSEHAKLYYKHFFSELSSKYNTLKDIIAIKNLLTLKNIPYLMTSVDELTVDTKWHIPDYVLNIQNEVKDDIIWFENKGFYNWAKDKGFKISDTWHPLEEAHQAAFEYIRDNYDIT